MEISESTKNKNTTNFNYIKSFILTFFGVLLLILIFLYLIYLFERYILYFSIYFIVKLLAKTFLSPEEILQNINLFILAIIITIFIHIKLFQIIIISFTFIEGGIFSRIYFYDEFVKVIIQQIESSKELNSCLYFSIQKNMTNFYNNILLFQKAYNNQKKADNKTFEIKQYEFGEILNNIVYLFEKFKEKNYEDVDIKNNLMNKLKTYQKDIQSLISLIKLLNFIIINLSLF